VAGGRRLTRSRTLAAGLFLLAGCVGDTTVRVPAASHVGGPSVLATIPPLRVKLGSIPDREVRSQVAGEREAAFHVSMGGVGITQDVGALVRENLAEDLRAGGHRLVDQGEEVSVTDAVRTLDVRTDATMLYWDVVGRLGVSVTVQGTGASRELQYAAERTERTYVWPGGAIMERVLAECHDDVRHQMSADPALAAALRAAAGR
jgi:uncharacterized lipoprotein YajG